MPTSASACRTPQRAAASPRGGRLPPPLPPTPPASAVRDDLRRKVARLEEEKEELLAASSARHWEDVVAVREALERQGTWAGELAEGIRFLGLGQLLTEHVACLTRDVCNEVRCNIDTLTDEVNGFRTAGTTWQDKLQASEQRTADLGAQAEGLHKGRRKADAVEQLLREHAERAGTIANACTERLASAAPMAALLREKLSASKQKLLTAVAEGREKCLRHLRNLEIVVERADRSCEEELLHVEEGVRVEAADYEVRMAAACDAARRIFAEHRQAQERLLHSKRNRVEELEARLQAMEDIDPAADTLAADLTAARSDVDTLLTDLATAAACFEGVENSAASFADRLAVQGLGAKRGRNQDREEDEEEEEGSIKKRRLMDQAHDDISDDSTKKGWFWNVFFG